MPEPAIRVELDVPAQMRDGVVLRANIYRPDADDGGPWPVLLTRLPYGKDLPLGSAALDPVQAARRGYIVVVQDVRGTFTSQGEWLPLRSEGPDGVDTIAWAAALPGSNGIVGMYGMSYFGFTQWAAAIEKPPTLRAIAPGITWSDAADGVFSRGGVYELGMQANWNLQTGLNQLMRRYQGAPGQLAEAIVAWAQEVDNLPGSGYLDLPLETFGALDRLGLLEPVAYYFSNRFRPAELLPASVHHGLHNVSIPVLHMGGWYDLFLGGTLHNFQVLTKQGVAHQQLVVGPWTHGNFASVQGDLDFGIRASGAMLDLQSDLMSYQLAFFDHYLKGADNGFERLPPVKYFQMGVNLWKYAATWPPSDAHDQHWYLHTTGGPAGPARSGWIGTQSPGNEPAATFIADPERPVPTVGGATLIHPSFHAGPLDQRAIEDREDVLAFTSAELDQPIEVAGHVEVRLFVASDTASADFVARLIDVYPDGTAIPCTDGILRVEFDLDSRQEQRPESGIREVTIDLWSTAVTFHPGHRLRLDVTGSSFPRWERNIAGGFDGAQPPALKPVHQTVFCDETHPSCLILPVMA